MAENQSSQNNAANSRLQSLVLDYKKTKKLIKAGKIAISIILILLLILCLMNLNSISWSSKIDAMNTAKIGDDFTWPYIGENGNWYLNGEDSGKPSTGEDGDTPSIGENGNWFIGGVDTGVTAQGAEGVQGEVPYIGTNGNWFVNGTDTGISAQGADGIQGLPGLPGSVGATGANGENGSDGNTPRIGENGNWWIGDVDTGISAQGSTGADGEDGQTPSIGENGNWWIGDTDTGIPARGADGQEGETPHIGANGNWWIGDTDTGIPARGADGATGPAGPAGSQGADGENGQTPYVGQNGNWWIGDTDTGIPATGATGATGPAGPAGPAGAQGERGETGETGPAGPSGANGLTPYIGANGNWWIGDTDTGVAAKGQGVNGTSSDGETPDNGNFTIQLEAPLRDRGIAISETRGFSNPTNYLACAGIKDSWNITLADIPTDLDSDMGGAKNGEYYLAYTFFMKNTGSETVDFNTKLVLENNNLDAIDAIRFAIYDNSTRKIYAAPAANGSKEVFACDESFSGNVNLINKSTTNFTPGTIKRYTVLMWYEGNDPECVDVIIGGSVKMSLHFEVLD